ncbi:monovalent cation/H+ antiporter subunit D [Roseicyclus sp. F158]|uniref:Monovalent cation/H+ antiporter subunit D n=1 Tax=Tropicimonas omnivorans TaxID=3075590 RepID=A0ABU3DJS6_9RHOB|nr:monovalent cation/H+ antiporter subunit D [Roseicyclus sp. F158]MDT0683367.1 monovalent cation/H+ antiporter subunit D [Roseicyclus sp. F158]
MNHWIVAPIVVPAILAPIMALAMRHDLVLQRVFSLAGTIATLLIGIGLFLLAGGDDISVYRLGDWPAPFGIVLVLDRLSAMMVMLTSALGLIVSAYAIGSDWDRRGWHFHPLLLFQVMGVNGAFLTGDAFNLFVFFEVLLIASYGLMIHGGGGVRMRAGIQYVAFNLAGSTLFLFALGTLYAVTGTLNMADMAVRMAELDPGKEALAMVGATLLLVVFAIKAALFPVQFWLPGTYANAPAPVAAMFAIMTKVGAYAILRIFTLVFAPALGEVGYFFSDILLPAALVTLIVGTLGTLGGIGIGRIVAFSVIGSMGTLMIAIAPFNEAGAAAAIYYIAHSTFATAALFLAVDLIRHRGEVGEVKPSGLVGAYFFAGAIAMAGMPPLSGFIGKLLILDASAGHPLAPWIWGIILATSILTIVGFAREGSRVFWKTAPVPGESLEEPEIEIEEQEAQAASRTVTAPMPAPLSLVAAALPLGMIVLLTIFSGPAFRYAEATAAQLFERGAYISAVLDYEGSAKRPAEIGAAKPYGYGDAHDGGDHGGPGDEGGEPGLAPTEETETGTDAEPPARPVLQVAPDQGGN